MVSTYDLILKKRNGESLTASEIQQLVEGYTQGSIPDYQMAAFLMAVYFRGMSPEETLNFTVSMVKTGEVLDLSPIPGKKVDKHSTGGVGDKTTLVLGPMVAAAGAPVVKMSGRGLGHTGGTLDKIQCFAGFNVALDPPSVISQVKRIGIALTGHNARLVPADAKIYALRDVTATVDSIPLIASSVMSKKIAAGADAIVLDVKVGWGALVHSLDQAIQLAQAMVNIGTLAGRETLALITNMDQPLGKSVGNALEVKEAIAALQGQGPEDLMELCLALGSHMLRLAGICSSVEQARGLLKRTVESGSALQKLRQLVEAQGGNVQAVDDPDLLPQAPLVQAVRAQLGGFVHQVDALKVGKSSVALGAGRVTKDSPIDPAVGVVLEKKVGDPVENGEVLAWVHARDQGTLDYAAALVGEAFVIAPQPVKAPRLIKAMVTSEGVELYEGA
ncbi:MAG: thymidine phosphorylase [Bacillota bacterium]